MAKKTMYKSQKLTAYGIYQAMYVFGSPSRELIAIELDYIDAKQCAKDYKLEHPTAKLMIEHVEVKIGAWDGSMPNKDVVENLA